MLTKALDVFFKSDEFVEYIDEAMQKVMSKEREIFKTFLDNLGRLAIERGADEKQVKQLQLDIDTSCNDIYIAVGESVYMKGLCDSVSIYQKSNIVLSEIEAIKKCKNI